MKQEDLTMQLDEWYDLIEGPSLLQGDILEGLPFLSPKPKIDWEQAAGDRRAEIDVLDYDVIVMSQSCDLKDDQKEDMWLVIACPVWTLSEAEKANWKLRQNWMKELCRQGWLTGYHMLAGCAHPDRTREVSIVSFREVLSVPLDFVRDFACKAGKRIRLRPPYREHLAQAFARYFMRVGLPVDVDRFDISKDVEKAAKTISAMEEGERAQFLSSLAAKNEIPLSAGSLKKDNFWRRVLAGLFNR